MEIKLAEALLRRKELKDKVDILKKFKENQVYYEVRGQRVKVTEGLEDINANYPKMTASQVTAEFDWHARQLRIIDAVIQQANWSTVLKVEDTVMGDFK
jgi:hypothetical protein